MSRNQGLKHRWVGAHAVQEHWWYWWALPGLPFHTCLIFESASNTCASMNNMDTFPNTHLFILDYWVSCLMNMVTVMLKKGKRCHVCRHPHNHHQTLLQIPLQTALQLCTPQPPTATHSWTDCVLIWEEGKHRLKEQQSLPVKSPSKLLYFPEMVMLLHSLERFLNWCFSQYLYSGCGYLIAEKDRLCWWQHVASTGSWGETWHRVKKHSLYILLFLVVKTRGKKIFILQKQEEKSQPSVTVF